MEYKAKITEIDIAITGTTLVYKLTADDGKVTLTQDLILSRDNYGEWMPEIKLDGFPAQKTASEAAKKLSEWLAQLSEAVLMGEYEMISLENDL